MNLEKEIGNSLEFMTNGGTSEIHRSDDGTIVARPTPVRMGATGMDLQPPIRRELSQAEPQTLEQTKKDVVPTLVGLPAGAAAATLGTLQDIAGLIYGGAKAMGAEEGQKMQTFLDTAGEISDKYGSGAVKGYVRQKAEEAGLDDDQLKVLDEAMMAGEFGGISGMAKAAVTKGPQMLSKAGDMVEGAGDAAKARMAEGGVTLTSGVDPDPLIAAAGDAVAKFRAPTEKKPGIIAFHGSGADFDEFKLEKIGTGEGAQAYGYGLYFTDSESIAKFYRDTVTGVDRFNQPDLDTQAGGFTQELGFDTVGGTHSLSSADPEYDYYIGELDKFAVNKSENLSQNSKTWEFSDGSELTLQTEGVMTFDGKPLDSVYTRDVEDRFGVDIKRIAEEARKMGIRDDVGTLEDDIGMIFSNLSQGLFNKKDAKTAVESLAGPSGPGAPSRYETIYSHFIEPKIDMTRVDYLMNAGQKKGKMYKVGLEPKPEDMLDYQGTFADQPKNVQDALKAIGYQVETDATGMKNAPAQIDIAAKKPMPIILKEIEQKIDDVIRNEMTHIKMVQSGKMSQELKDKILEKNPFDKAVLGKIEENERLNLANPAKILSELLLEQGVPGIKYRAAGSRAASVDAADAEMNYVIFDDKMIKILEKYGIVGPVAITGIAASKQESEPDAGA